MPKEDALFWKEHNIPPQQAVKYYQEWSGKGIPKRNFLYFATKTNASSLQYKEAIKALADYYDTTPETIYNQADVSFTIGNKIIEAVIKNIQSGSTPKDAVVNFVQQARKGKEKEELAQWEPTIIKQCNGVLTDILDYINESNNPYSVKDKCYFLYLGRNITQWISDHKTLVTVRNDMKQKTIMYITATSPIKDDNTAIIKGITPQTYSDALGKNKIIPSFKIMGYHYFLND